MYIYVIQLVYDSNLLILHIAINCDKFVLTVIYTWMNIGADECAQRCQHKCVSTNTSVLCGCRPGFYLLSNQQDCAGIYLYVTILV